MTPKAARTGLGVVGVVLGVVAVVALREATLSTHQPVDPPSRMAVVVDARTRSGERGQSLPEMVEALLLTCRLEVNSDLVGPARVVDEGGGRFRAVLQPALDETNRRQLRGCVEDWMIDHLLVDVVAFEAVGPAEPVGPVGPVGRTEPAD